MKFDICLMNPPYDKDLHLQFFNKSLDILSPTGSMCIVEPATWLINIRKNGKAHSIYEPLKNRIDGHVKSVLIENYNKEFNTGMYTPFSITTIDYSTNYTAIDYECCGEKKTVKSIYDCNLIGNYDLIWSILHKLQSYKDMMRAHITDKKEKTGMHYCKYMNLIGRGICADPRDGDVWYKNDLYAPSYYWPAFDDRPPINISPEPLKSLKSGYTYSNPVYTDRTADNLYDTKSHLENYKYNCFNLKIIPFVNIVMYVDQNNQSFDYIPWLVNKKYTDNEIYKLFNFTKDEIRLIETTIEKFKKNSLWFKRYMHGQEAANNQDIQKYIDNL